MCVAEANEMTSAIQRFAAASQLEGISFSSTHVGKGTNIEDLLSQYISKCTAAEGEMVLAEPDGHTLVEIEVDEQYEVDEEVEVDEEYEVVEEVDVDVEGRGTGVTGASRVI